MQSLMPGWRLPIAVSMQFGESPKLLTSLIEIVRWRYRWTLVSPTDISLWRGSSSKLATSREH